MKKNYISFLMLFCFSMTSIAQVVINEYSASNLESFTDSFGKTEDWIELYNNSNTTIDISGWHLSDKETKPEKWEIPVGTMIPANGYLVFFCSGRDLVTSDGEYHTNFKLAQTKNNEIVLLSDASGTVLESHTMDLTLVEHSRCRATDGGSEWMVGTAPTLGTSNNGAAQVAGYTQAPSMDLEAGYHTGTQTVTITNNEPNSVLRYTTDGTNPIASSPEYTTPLEIMATQVVKALAFSNDPMILPGKMDFNTYFIDEDFSLAVFSVAADDVIELANGQGELIPIGSLEYFNTDKEREATSFGSLNRHGQDSWVLDHRSIDWISRDEMGYSKAVNAPIFGYSERDEYQKFMFRNSGDDNYPAIDDGEHEGATHIRDEYVHTLGQLGGMELDQRAVERVIVFLNGQYWGVYGMRERPVDHDYTDEYYDQGKYEVQYLSTWNTTEIEYGGLQALADWENLRNFILENDMSDTANYTIAEDSINMTSLIDYFVMNQNVVASDWLNYNTGWWRGLNPDGKHKKWGYILWDLDATFDYYINYTGVPNTSPNAQPCDLDVISESMDNFFGTEVTNHGAGAGGIDTTAIMIDTSIVCTTITNGSSPYPITDTIFHQVIQVDDYCCNSDWDNICQNLYDDFAAGGNGGGNNAGEYEGNVGSHEKIFLKLLDESPEFKQLYYSRYADLMNTVFTCENMITLLDSMLAVIEPEMPRQIQRWGGTMSEWESNVQDLKDFINERCTLLDDGALECYDELSGPHTITLLTQPNTGIGEIDFNTLDIETFPWTGDYFGGMENKIKAKVFDEFADDYEFSHWISSADNFISPSVNTRKAWITLDQPDTLTAVFILKGTVSAEDLEAKYNVNVFPNPAKDFLVLEYELEKTMNVQVSLYSVLGEKVADFSTLNGRQSAGKHTVELPLESEAIASGLYFLVVDVENDQKSFKINIVK